MHLHIDSIYMATFACDVSLIYGLVELSEVLQQMCSAPLPARCCLQAEFELFG
jgi:hypothetical protein